MKKIFINILLLNTFFLLLHCGFKTVDRSKISDFTIKEINTIGNKRINFKIKNNLMLNSVANSANILSISIKTKKVKEVKEKNIKNEITKYQIILTSNINFKSTQQEKDASFNVETRGDYLVGNNYSSTLNNEKRLIDNLVENLSEKIINQINIKLDDI